ncbi:prepilin-type N-terminal cleavage/methylation domain-containing protein [Rubritalea sp.]|uniref:prepilin-type N-terminal cleavage/methylation domain-containing protein n=1 Tax=Rubritalea sp. TaxID=2109375 RepID=UPI003EF11D2D
MKVLKPKSKKGYTLIELSVVMVLVVLIASTLTTMLNQQLQFLKWWNTQKFIAEDAPLVNNMVVRLFSQADAFRVCNDHAAALAGTGLTVTVDGLGANVYQGSAIIVGFSQSDGGDKRYGIISYNAVSQIIEYSIVTNIGGVLTIAAGDRWTMASNVASAVFSVQGSGIMQLTLTGPYGGQITYAASPSL